MLGNDKIIAQVERIMALLFNATYPGNGMWRFKTACEAVARGAKAEVSGDDVDGMSCSWFAAAVSILKMETNERLVGWDCYTPRQQTEIAMSFLPAAEALVEWANAIRRHDAQEQECDWTQIDFLYDAPEGVVLNKLGGYEDGPNVELIKKLLFTEDDRCEVVYEPKFFRQLDNGLDIGGDSIDYSEPEDSDDIEECNAIIRELYKNRAKLEKRKDDDALFLPEHSFQEIIEDLSASNEEFIEQRRKEYKDLCRKIDASVSKSALFNDAFSAIHEINSQKPESKGDEKVDESEKADVKNMGRFMISRYDDRIDIKDTQNKKSYSISRPGGIAAKAILTLIKDYATGTRQVHDSNRGWKGAMQSGRGDATLFKRDQIFMLPKWNVEKKRYLNGQYCGKWRLWTDDEMKLSVAERIKNHKREFPNGHAWQ